MEQILIKGGRVFMGDGFERLDILTEGTRVVKIAPDITDEAIFTYDATGKMVVPGLVDAHIHIRGVSCDEYGTDGDMSTLPFGVTAAADASAVLGDKGRLDTHILKSVVFVPARIEDNRADFTETEEMLAKYGERVVGVKICFDTRSYDVRDTSPLKEICQYAHERGLIVMVHCSCSPTPMKDIVETLGRGDILTHAYHGGVNSAAEDNYAALRIARERGVIIDAGLAGHVHTDFQVFRGAVMCGEAPDIISTDITRLSAYKRGGRYGMTMCMSIARAMGMDEVSILRAVTENSARVLGKADVWGKLEVGRCADIAVLDMSEADGYDLTDAAGNNIKAERGYRCVLAVANGEVVYKD